MDVKKRLNEITSRAELERFRLEVQEFFDHKLDDLYAKKNQLGAVLKDKVVLYKKKVGVWKRLRQGPWSWNIRYIVSMPFIYAMIIPALFLHAAVEIYQHVCFRLYGIPRVSPKGYFIFDRNLLPYLNWLEKINCFYCSYFNGLMGFVSEIAGQTERYWCPIKHARRRMVEHSQYVKFLEYGDAKDFHKRWEELRKKTKIQ